MISDSAMSGPFEVNSGLSTSPTAFSQSTEMFDASVTGTNHAKKTGRPTLTVLSSDSPNTALQQRQIYDLTKKIEEFTSEFYRTIEHDYFEFGVTANIERMVEKWLARDLKTTQLALAQIFQDNQRLEKVMVGVLKIIAHVDSELLQPMNRAVACAALSLPFVEVRECAVRAYEYWERPDFMVDLEMRPLTPAWLEEYKQTVIAEAQG
jgi:hypothetical protein